MKEISDLCSDASRVGVASGFSGGVFISYRRSLSGDHAGRLHKKLQAKFGAHRVFFDECAIPQGALFPKEIQAALYSADVILILISQGWIDHIRDRATKPDVDWVLKEVETTLGRLCSNSIPSVYVVLFGDVSMPSASNLPDSIKSLADVNAHKIDDEMWDEDNASFKLLVDDIVATLPQETTKINIKDLAESCCENIFLRLDNWRGIREIDVLCNQWRINFNPPLSCSPVQALNQLRGKIEEGRKMRRLSREGLDMDRAGMIRDDLVAVVAELLQLGACRVTDGLDVLGDLYRPANVEAMATQVFAVASGQRRKATVRFEAGSMSDVGRVSVERTVDQRTVNSGVLEDKSSDLLDQLWNLVPEFVGKEKTYRRDTKNPDELADLASALRAMNSEDKSRVAIALEGDCVDAVGAIVLRRWLARMHLDVDVLVRTGKSHTKIKDQEKDLILAAWRCLQQIEGVGGERPR